MAACNVEKELVQEWSLGGPQSCTEKLWSERQDWDHSRGSNESQRQLVSREALAEQFPDSTVISKSLKMCSNAVSVLWLGLKMDWNFS